MFENVVVWGQFVCGVVLLFVFAIGVADFGVCCLTIMW